MKGYPHLNYVIIPTL